MRAIFSASLPENPYLMGLLILFVGLFCALVLRLYRPSKAPDLDQESRLPLQD